jgi:hypothetical protein
VGCGNPWELLLGKLKPICLGTFGIWYLQFVKGRNCEIHIDVGLCLISIQNLSDICANNFMGEEIAVHVLILCKTMVAY